MCWAAKTDEMVTDGNPVVIGHPRERERESGDAREKSEMPRLRGIRRTNRCNYGSPGTDVGYVDPSSSLGRSSDCDHPRAGNERAPPFSSAIRVSKFFSRLETRRSYLRTRAAEKEKEEEKGWPK